MAPFVKIVEFGHGLQALSVPFVLENLGCTGRETRLVDCPVDEGDGLDYTPFPYDYSNPGLCGPYLNTFARIACGGSTSAGVHLCGATGWLQVIAHVSFLAMPGLWCFLRLTQHTCVHPERMQ